MATVLQSRPPVGGRQVRGHPAAAASLNAEPAGTPSGRYHPLVIVLAAAAAGIVVDRYRPLAFPVWCILAAAALGCWFVVNRRRKELAAGITALIAVAALAAAWHHDCWNLFGADDVGLFARSRQEPVCIEAVALQTPCASPQADSNPLRLSRLDEEVRFTVEIDAIRDGDQWRTASGRAALAVEGPLPYLAVGDRFRAFAHLLPPDHALNPGETDRADLDRGRRITAHLRVTYPEAITVVAGGHGIVLGAWLDTLRLRGRQVFGAICSHVKPIWLPPYSWDFASNSTLTRWKNSSLPAPFICW